MAGATMRNRVFAGAAASMLVFGGGIGTAPAFAQSTKVAAATQECKARQGELFTRSRCAVERLKNSEIRLENAQRQRKEAASGEACVDAVTRDILEAKKIGPLSDAQKAAFRGRLNGCTSG